MARCTDDDTLQVLNHLEWKQVLRIRDELKELKNSGSSEILSLFFAPSIGWVSDSLERLVKQGWVEERKGTDPEIMKRRGGRKYSEFKLSERGMRCKADIIEKRKSQTPLEGSLLPVPGT